MQRVAISLLSAGLLIGAGAASAQSVPPGQSCGGLLCDMGVFGHKVPAEPATPPVAAPTPTAAMAPTTLPPAVTAEPTPHKVLRPRHLANATVAKAPRVKVMAAAKAIPAKRPVVADPAAAMPAAAKADVSTPANDWVIGGGKAGSQAAPGDMFQPIYR